MATISENGREAGSSSSSMRWAWLYSDDRVRLEFAESQIRSALVEAFKKTNDVGQAFDLVRESLRSEAGRH